MRFQRGSKVGSDMSINFRDSGHRLFDLIGRVGEVLQLAGAVLIVGGEVEVAVAAEVKQDDAPLAGLAGGQRLVDGGLDGVGGLRRVLPDFYI